MKLREKAIRTAISIFLCILVTKLFHLKYPFFVALPAVMPITNSVEETLKAGRNRMYGTIIGAAVGVLLVLISPGSAVLSGIGIIIILYLCTFIRWGTAASIAGLVFISIMVGIKGEIPFIYSLNRIFDTLIGIFITIIVNNLIFHKDLSDILSKSFINITNDMCKVVKEKICENRKIDLTEVLKEIETVKNQFKIFEEEIKFRKSSSIKVAELRDILNLIIAVYEHIKVISAIDISCSLREDNYEKFFKLYGENCAVGSCHSKELNVVFNYHISYILDSLIYLKNKAGI